MADGTFLDAIRQLLAGRQQQPQPQPQQMSQLQFGNPHRYPMPAAGMLAPPQAAGGIADQFGGQAGAMQRYQQYAVNAASNGQTPMPLQQWVQQQAQGAAQ